MPCRTGTAALPTVLLRLLVLAVGLRERDCDALAPPPRATIVTAHYRGTIVAAAPAGAGQRTAAARQWLSAANSDNENDGGGDTSGDGSDGAAEVAGVVVVVSPVLRRVHPALVRHVQEFGHPNIPLGSSAGRQCATLRRLRSQDALAESDVALLDDLGFAWHALEDVYAEQKDRFDDFLHRLRLYAASHDGDDALSPPKKYAADPELGAWVTAVRRLRLIPGAVDASHVTALDAMHFAWTSPKERQCGSQFMRQYRRIRERLAGDGRDGGGGNSDDDDSTTKAGQRRAAVWSDPDVMAWLAAQRQADLSLTRQHYMAELAGPDWRHRIGEIGGGGEPAR